MGRKRFAQNTTGLPSSLENIHRLGLRCFRAKGMSLVGTKRTWWTAVSIRQSRAKRTLTFHNALSDEIASSDALHGNGEYISDAALSLDDARRARIALELAPQPENLHVDAAIENIFVNARCL